MGDNALLMKEEVEIKLALPETAVRAFLRHPLLRDAERLPTRRLSNLYYDTPGLDLHRQGIALRTRRQGRARLQTVKCAGTAGGGLSQRPEWEQPFGGRFDFAGIDDEAVRAALERHRVQDHLEPAFETVFTRRCWRLAPARGPSVLLMLDRGWIDADGRRETISEIEIEIELERGKVGVLFGLARALAADLPVQAEILSKAERGYRLRRNAPPVPVKAAPSPLLPAHTPLEAFRRITAACLAQFQANALGAGEANPEFVHQMRVALRRLRSALRTFRPALPQGFEAAVVPPLRALAATLGQARDWDVLAEDIVAPVRQAFPDDARLAALAAAVEHRRRAAHLAVQEALAERPLVLALLDFSARLHRIADAPADEALADFAHRRLGRLRRKALALAKKAQDRDPARLHALRIGIKRLRYAIEFFAPLCRERGVRDTLATLTALQDSLGALNDLARAGPLLAQCMDDDPALREAVALAGGWHGPRHAALQKLTFQGLRRLKKLTRFRKE
ncbi:MAG: CHAD domain-containing protein [Betaproteobacteria bacterium]|nr:CHAD domain-containing protein [Betaproteobacteria bacterium]